MVNNQINPTNCNVLPTNYVKNLLSYIFGQKIIHKTFQKLAIIDTSFITKNRLINIIESVPIPNWYTASFPNNSRQPSICKVNRPGCALHMSDFEITEQDEQQFDQVFPRLNPENGKINGQNIRRYSSRLNIDNRVLGQIWSLVDTDEDGHIDKRELFIFLKLTRVHLKEIPIPEVLPSCLSNYSIRTQPEIFDNITNIGKAHTLEEIFQLPSNFVPDSYQNSLIDQINTKLEEKKRLNEQIGQQKAINFKLEKELQNVNNRLCDEQKKYNISRKEEINLVAKIEKALAEGLI